MDVNDNFALQEVEKLEDDDLLEELPEREEMNKVEIDSDGLILQKITNDSGLETCDSMDIAKDTMPELTPMTELVPLRAENASEMPKNFTFLKLTPQLSLPELLPLPPSTHTTPLDSPKSHVIPHVARQHQRHS